MIEELAAQTYTNLGFPVEILSHEKSDKAVVTYPSGGAGFFVIDVDAHYGGMEALKRIQKHIPFPKTVTARTQQGGLHFYFKYPKGVKIPSRVDTTRGIDVLADDSRVTMPPTFGFVGNKRYTWIHAPQTTPIAEAPMKLLTFINAEAI